MPTPGKARPLGRYSRRRAILEIEEQLRRRGRGAAKELAAGIGFTASDVSKRMRDVSYHWTIEDLGRIADFWKAPTDWPWIPWDLAVERDRAWADYQQRRRG